MKSGRPRTLKRWKPITIPLEVAVLKKIDAMAKARGVTRSALVRGLLGEALR